MTNLRLNSSSWRKEVQGRIQIIQRAADACQYKYYLFYLEVFKHYKNLTENDSVALQNSLLKTLPTSFFTKSKHFFTIGQAIKNSNKKRQHTLFSSCLLVILSISTTRSPCWKRSSDIPSIPISSTVFQVHPSSSGKFIRVAAKKHRHFAADKACNSVCVGESGMYCETHGHSLGWKS